MYTANLEARFKIHSVLEINRQLCWCWPGMSSVILPETSLTPSQSPGLAWLHLESTLLSGSLKTVTLSALSPNPAFLSESLHRDCLLAWTISSSFPDSGLPISPSTILLLSLYKLFASQQPHFNLENEGRQNSTMGHNTVIQPKAQMLMYRYTKFMSTYLTSLFAIFPLRAVEPQFLTWWCTGPLHYLVPWWGWNTENVCQVTQNT
jgi:hypothetical protein